ncbi:MAG: hypothetical protein V4519_05085 [Patescibacteria group bacterium]
MKTTSKICSLFVIVALFVGSFALTSPHIASAATGDWQKGASIDPTSSGEYATEAYRASLRNLRSTGANTVSLVIPYYVANTTASDIQNGWNTPTDAALIDGITYAKSLGFKVVLKPHLESHDGVWRASINPSNRSAFYTNYSAKLNHLGDIGRQTGAAGIVVGSELITVATYTSNSDNTQRWSTMIDSLRTRFPGFLTYSANWGSGDFAEEVPHIGFWNKLDYIGISGYYPLAEGQWNPSQEALKSSWNNWNTSKIKPISDQYGKKVIFTEIGYMSVDNSHSQPWNSGMGGAYNAQEQVNNYEALFSFWNDKSHIEGMYLWDWIADPAAGGQGNRDYTPQNKPAFDTLKKWYGTTGTTPTNPTNPTQPQPGAWNTTGTVTGNTVNNPVSLKVDLTNSGSVSGAIVDLEVYNSADQKIFQKFYENQTVSNGQPGSYTTSWTPTTAGTYKLKVGVFNNNWTTAYYWNGNVSTITVGQGQTTPPATTTPPTTPTPTPTTYSTNIWWPTDGSSVNGVVPLKAMLTNKAIADYKMYWQVDGGGLVEMFNSNQDYPHKEALVDFIGWNWKGQGPYTLNFVSKDNAGNTTFSQKAVNVFVK